MCYDYMNGNLCKHLHRIHSLTVENAEDINNVDLDDVEMVVAGDDNEETEEQPVNPYVLPSGSTRSTCETLVYSKLNIRKMRIPFLFKIPGTYIDNAGFTHMKILNANLDHQPGYCLNLL